MQSVHITTEVVSLNPIHPFKVTDDDLGFFFFFFSYGMFLLLLLFFLVLIVCAISHKICKKKLFQEYF
jgi:hypothetical protein